MKQSRGRPLIDEQTTEIIKAIIRELRSRRMSDVAIARTCGVSRSTIAFWRKGKGISESLGHHFLTAFPELWRKYEGE